MATESGFTKKGLWLVLTARTDENADVAASIRAWRVGVMAGYNNISFPVDGRIAVLGAGSQSGRDSCNQQKIYCLFHDCVAWLFCFRQHKTICLPTGTF
jgi:hypothetical protein